MTRTLESNAATALLKKSFSARSVKPQKETVALSGAMGCLDVPPYTRAFSLAGSGAFEFRGVVTGRFSSNEEQFSNKPKAE